MAKQSTPHKNCKEADTYIYIISGVYIYIIIAAFPARNAAHRYLKPELYQAGEAHKCHSEQGCSNQCDRHTLKRLRHIIQL